MSGFRMLASKKVYVNGVSVRHRVRCYRLISLRKSSPPRTMIRIHYSSLDRWRITLSAVMLTLCVIVSFSPCQTQGPLGNRPGWMEGSLGNGPSIHHAESVWRWRWSALLCHGECMGWATQGGTAQRNLKCVQLRSRVGICQLDRVQGAHLRRIAPQHRLWALL